jgi:DNA-binding transcriptional MocR family regulator
MVDVMLREGHYERHLFRLRRRLEAATAQALQVLDGLGAEVFARPASSLYLWPAFPGIDDTVALARELMSEKILLAPGRIFSVDADEPSARSRCNVGALVDPRFSAALRARLR